MSFLSRFRRRHAVAFVASAVVASVAVGSGVAYAYWTATATATGTASSLSVSVTQSNFAGVAKDYVNSTLNQPVTDNLTLSNTAAFTVTNTGSAAGTVTAGAATTEPFAAKMQVRFWTVAAASACTAATAIPATAGTGTWADVTFLSNVSMAAGASAIICTRTTALRTDVADVTGSLSATSTLTATIAANGWTAQTTATQQQRTLSVYPLSNDTAPLDRSRWYRMSSATNDGICLDVSGGGTGVVGTPLISYGCGSQQLNQRFQIIPVGSSQSLVQIRPRSASTLRVTESATKVDLQTASISPAQQWYVQRVGTSGSVFQFVSAASGMCLPIKANQDAATTTTVPCNDARSRITMTRDPLGMSTAAACPAFTMPQDLASSFQVQRWTGSAWTQVATATSGATTLNVSSSSLSEGANALRIVYGTAAGGTDVAYDGISVTKTTTFIVLVSCAVVSGNGS